MTQRDQGHTEFGSYLRALRHERNVGQRELARAVGVSASYLNDIENHKRSAPRAAIIERIAEILKVEDTDIHDLAGRSRGTLPTDLQGVVARSPAMISLLRKISEYNFAEDEIGEIEAIMEDLNLKVLIIAAGIGDRLRPYTDELPKCLLELGGKTLLQRQLEAYRACKIKNVSLVRGYKKEKINEPNINYYENPNFENNNILNSLMCAEEEINGNIIISYSDILFEKEVVERLIASIHDISIVVDIDWTGYYVNRKDHPIEEAENVIFDADNKVVRIGKILTDRHDVHGEFIGMMKLTPRGAEIFKKHFHNAKKLYWGKPFQTARDFEKAYLTDMFQEMVDLGVPVHCVIVERGWREIDTVEDYENALRYFSE